MLEIVENCYSNVPDLSILKNRKIPFLDSFNKHHFGITDDLWECIKFKYKDLWDGDNYIGEKEEFEDVFYDTEELSLIKQNYWLKVRYFNSGRDPEWSLRTNKRQNDGYFMVVEDKIQDRIVEKLKKLFPKKYILDHFRFPGCDVMTGNFHLKLFVFFPTTRLILEKHKGFKFYIDISGEDLTPTWFLSGGIHFYNINQTNHLSIFQTNGWKSNVLSKVEQYLSWVDIDIFKNLVNDGGIIDTEYSDEHIHSDKPPYCPLP